MHENTPLFVTLIVVTLALTGTRLGLGLYIDHLYFTKESISGRTRNAIDRAAQSVYFAIVLIVLMATVVFR